MTSQSRWIIDDYRKNQIVRASTIKPRIDYATEIVDSLLDILVQKKQELNKTNLEFYRKIDGNKESIKTLRNQIRQHGFGCRIGECSYRPVTYDINSENN